MSGLCWHERERIKFGTDSAGWSIGSGARSLRSRTRRMRCRRATIDADQEKTHDGEDGRRHQGSLGGTDERHIDAEQEHNRTFRADDDLDRRTIRPERDTSCRAEGS